MCFIVFYLTWTSNASWRVWWLMLIIRHQPVINILSKVFCNRFYLADFFFFWVIPSSLDDFQTCSSILMFRPSETDGMRVKMKMFSSLQNVIFVTYYSKELKTNKQCTFFFPANSDFLINPFRLLHHREHVCGLLGGVEPAGSSC